jgi:hypothetical protein
MPRPLAVFALLLLTSCSDQRRERPGISGAAASAVVADGSGLRAEFDGSGLRAEFREQLREIAPMFATAHTMSIEARGDAVPALADSARARCAALAGCVLTGTHEQRGEFAEAQLTFRVPAASMAGLRAALRSLGRVSGETSTQTDVSRSVTDTERRLALLRDLQARLEAIRDREAKDVEAVIRVAEKLAETQQEIEALSGTGQSLREQVATEALTLRIGGDTRSAWRPLRDAFNKAGDHFVGGVAAVVTVVTSLAAPVTALVLLVWGWRRWRRRAVSAR